MDEEARGGVLTDAMDDTQYDGYIQRMRGIEYPMLQDTLYLDHAGTTPPSKSLLDAFHHQMTSQLYGNPHSFSKASLGTAEEIERTRLRLLDFCHASPEYFDVVFTANATAAMKLVGDALRDGPNGFAYYYHSESHTSLVGVRQLAVQSQPLLNDRDVGIWLEQGLDQGLEDPVVALFAYPAQSNLDGRRLPLDWPRVARLRNSSLEGTPLYTLLDAAAYASTSTLDLSDADAAPDFIALSLYKIFGFPDLGALIVRRASGTMLGRRRYFGGGTVNLVTIEDDKSRRTRDSTWQDSCNLQVRKENPLHEGLEDGTLPYHSIVALGIAMTTHCQLFGSMDRVSRHTSHLRVRLIAVLSRLRHANGNQVARIYDESPNAMTRYQGPIVTFNLADADGKWVSLHEFEKIAFARNINVRTGTHCNPGGTAKILHLSAAELHDNYRAGYRCGGEGDIQHGRPTGAIRVSLGAMSTRADVDKFLSFIREFYVQARSSTTPPAQSASSETRLTVSSLTVYPIKSCSGWAIPKHVKWEVRPQGLAWDREWCIVHAQTGKALSQKRHPRMALIRPTLDIENGFMLVSGRDISDDSALHLKVALSRSSSNAEHWDVLNAQVCGAACSLEVLSSSTASMFFTKCLGVPCLLARFPEVGEVVDQRHSRHHLNRGMQGLGRHIALSNESPILVITQASVDYLNTQVHQQDGKIAASSVFRANMILDRDVRSEHVEPEPFAEDDWSSMVIRDARYDFLGSCRRCQMICIDQNTAERNSEPFSTLAKIRRIDGRVVFGVHTSLSAASRQSYIAVGDEVFIDADDVGQNLER